MPKYKNLLVNPLDSKAPVQVGILLDDRNAVFVPDYCFVGDKAPDQFTIMRLREICEAFAYSSGFSIIIRQRGKPDEMVKYDAPEGHYVR